MIDMQRNMDSQRVKLWEMNDPLLNKQRADIGLPPRGGMSEAKPNQTNYSGMLPNESHWINDPR